MNFYTIYQDIKAHGFEVIVLIGCLLKFIEISPIKLNPWSRLKKNLEKFFCGNLNEQIVQINKTLGLQNDEITEMKKDLNEERAKTARYRIIRFDDEMMHGVEHSDDHKEQIMEDISTYEVFCALRPYVKNHKGTAAMQRITDRYKKKLPM